MTKFYVCKQCETVVGKICGGGNLICCGKTMEGLPFNNSEGLSVKVKGDVVEVDFLDGVKNHKSIKNGVSGFVYLKTENGGQRKQINNLEPINFILINDIAVSVYAYIFSVGVYFLKIK